MVQQISKSELGSPILKQVREGMMVYDQEGKKVGKVKEIYLGAVSDEVNEQGIGPATAYDPDIREDSLLDNIAEAFAAADDKLPKVLRNRLLHHGFIRINSTGLFASDRYALPDQIASISDDGVYLSVLRDELIKR